MMLILCALDDVDAITFAAACRRAGTDCRVLTGEALSFAARRRHSLRDGAPVSTVIELAGSQTIDDEATYGVLNRLVEPPSAAWQFAQSYERDYASAEMYAFTVSWVASLNGRVRNRPTAECLAGPLPHPVVLVSAAQRSGLDCPPFRMSTAADTTTLAEAATRDAGPGAELVQVVLLDGEVISPDVPASLAAACARFAALIDAEQAILGVDFCRSGQRWVLAGVTPVPRLAAIRDKGRRRITDQLAGTDKGAA